MALAVCAMAFPAIGQVNLADERLEGIELDYEGLDYEKKGASIYRDLTYWNFFASRTKGWNGGDGVYTTLLPEGNVFWSFGDSFFGVVSEFRNRKRPNNLPRNAAMIQVGEHSAEDFITLNEYVSTDPNDREHYMKGKTWLRHPDGSKTQAEIDNGDTDSNKLYWPGDATVVTDADGDLVLQMLVGAVDDKMYRDETSLAEYYLDGTPGDGKYMTLKKLTQHIVPYTAGYGSAILEDGGHCYLYSTEGTGGFFGGAWAIVARSKTLDLHSEWEYYIKDESGKFGWTTTPPTLEERRRSNISNDDWVMEPSVFRYGGKYYMVTQDIAGGAVYILQAEYPWGPFKNRHKLFEIPQSELTNYNTFVHPQCSRTGEIVVSYNMNPIDEVYYTKGSNGEAVENVVGGFWRNFNAWGSADLYQPHFLRIFNWQKIYGVENIGPITDAWLNPYDGATGSEETVEAKSTNFTVYPTSVESTLNIDASVDNYAWQIVNLSGVVVKNGSNDDTFTQIDVADLASGMYIVKVYGNGTSVSTKIIKK